MKQKVYEVPDMAFICLEAEEIVTISGPDDNFDDLVSPQNGGF